APETRLLALQREEEAAQGQANSAESSQNRVLAGLDEIDEQLKAEGLARELVNRVQNLRKDAGLNITDRIQLVVCAVGDIRRALEANLDYIRTETLATDVVWTEAEAGENLQLEDGASVWAQVHKS
ncbi:MAG: DUF5915 domain-containing protein, partial [Flavobacteriales bacterium]